MLVHQHELGLVCLLRDLGVQHRPEAAQRRDTRLDPGVPAGRARALAADADPSGDVARVDGRPAREGDGRADAVTATGRLMPCVRVAAGVGIRDARATGGRGRRDADERDDAQHTDESRKERPQSHLSDVGGRRHATHPR